jgi:hypothetical protein
MARASNYYDLIGRSSNQYNNNAVNVLYTADELDKIQYSPEVFGNEENYWIWVKGQTESNIIELLNTLKRLYEQAGQSNETISQYVLAGAAVVSKVGFSTLYATILAGAGTLLSVLEKKSRTTELENLQKQVLQVQNELAKQKARYDEAVQKLAGFRNNRLFWGIVLAFLVYLFTRKSS